MFRTSRKTRPSTFFSPTSGLQKFIPKTFFRHTQLYIVFLSSAFFIPSRANRYDLPLPVLPVECPVGFIRLPSSQHCYGFQVGAPNDNLQTWKEAETSCRRDGGDLTQVPRQSSSATAFLFLRQKASQMSIPSAWVARPPVVARMDEQRPGGNFSNLPKSHICTYVEFPKDSTEVFLTSVGCNHETRNFICDIKIAAPQLPPQAVWSVRRDRHRPSQPQSSQQDTDSEQYSPLPRRSRFLDTKPSQTDNKDVKININNGDEKNRNGKKEGKNEKEMTISISTRDANQIIPDNLSGLAKIPPVRVTQLVRARMELLVRMYGSATVTGDMLEPGFLPVELDTANISRAAMQTAKMLLLEMSADTLMKKRKGSNATETAKSLTIHLLEDGHPVQCYYGVNQQRRVVACLGSHSKIETCAKIVTTNGRVVRSCGLPGYKQSGCHHTIDGVVCHCDQDECNSARKFQSTNFFFLPLTIFSFFIFRHYTTL